MIAQFAWHTPYSWATNAISDLGAAHCGHTGTDNPPDRYVCSSLHPLMNTAIVILGITLALGAIMTRSVWGRGGPARTAWILFVVADVGAIIAGSRPEVVDLNLHVVGAFLLIGVGNVGLLLASFARSGSFIGRRRGLTVTLAVIANVPTWLMFTHHTPGLGYGGMERVAIYPLLAWTVMIAVAVLRAASSIDANSRVAGRRRDEP